MKSKILILAAVAIVLFSCGTKKTAPAAPVAPATPAVTTTAAPAKAIDPTDLAVGQNLYENNCAKCHKLFDPKKFTHDEWTPILAKMSKKAHLDETQTAAVTNYIDSKL